ncbi:hypothetical protein GCK72_009770 [Caenorhabditis remanei]|uniref:EF-hand domain-containing protein n=1 Tax=Caenorhabditis remanei TaxID=31234 RepID=A0A6A5H442_CAERE|nr:hypothetical protein GCK72_009770 [Caenorhabditis remanei]KAF1761514.1 hypothetical protein GCK72_009770 [Caenorhabditis remanei]
MDGKFPDENIVREIAGRRIHVLQKFTDFEEKALKKRRLLVQSGQLQHFLSEFKQVIEVFIDTAEAINIRHSSDYLARTQKNLNKLRGEVDGQHQAVSLLEKEAHRLVNDGHYASEDIQKTLAELQSRWEYLLELLDLKWLQVQKDLESMEFSNKCSSILKWMSEAKTVENPEKDIFDEIRKYSVVWNDILVMYQQIVDPSPVDTENFELVRDTWIDFQQYVDSIHKELDSHQRVQKFIDNADYLKLWMANKEEEIHGKYSQLSVEEAMKYRKTIELEIKSTEQRIKNLEEEAVDPNSREQFQNNPDIQKHLEEVVTNFKSFQSYIEKWRFDLETAAELDTLQKDADDIRYWCSEKVEDLKVMERSESADCDEIAMWIETNNFDFNSWDNVVDQFTTSAQEIWAKAKDETFRNDVEKIKAIYSLAKKTSETCNEILEMRIETINMEKLIYQTHQKAAYLVSVLQKNDEVLVGIKIEDAETELRMMDGVAVRCSSVVEQIEHIELKMRHCDDQYSQLSDNASIQFNQLAEMKNILKNSPGNRKSQLQRYLDVSYFADRCRDVRKHAETMLNNLKDGKIKRESVQPIKEQIEALYSEMVGLDLEDGDRTISEDDLNRAKKTLQLIENEYESISERQESKKAAERTEKFVQRVHQWIEDSLKDADETDFSLQHQNLHRTLSNYNNILSSTAVYKASIEKRRGELSDSASDNIQKNLLDKLQNSLEMYEDQIHQKSTDTENALKAVERMSELNSQNDWIKSKIKILSNEQICDSSLIAQKMNRRYEKDSEEIENRRKHINEVVLNNITGENHPILEEIENNWNRMKTMFDEKGGVLERMIKLYEYDEESTTTSEWLRDKMMYADAIVPKEDESLNRIMVKKLEALADDVESYKTKIVETHALLEDALVTPKTKDSVSQQVIKLKSALTRKQGEIESDYVALKRMVEKKLAEFHSLLQDADVAREIADMERWIEEEENQLNRHLAADSEELPNQLDNAILSIQRRRSNLTNIKCAAVGGGQFQTQKLDDAFDMLDVFAFEVDRIRQKANRSSLLKKLKVEAESVIDAIQTTRERIDTFPTASRKRGVIGELQNLDGDLETLRRRVIASLDKAKEVRAANADLAPQVYDLEERLEKEWTDVSKAAENRKKRIERGKLLAELENELLDMEHWIDTFNEEVIIVTGGIHDGLGVQVGLESIDTWREELSHRVDQLGNVKNALASVLNTLTNQEERNKWLERVSDIESDLVKARKTIDAKQDELSDFSNVLGAERDCERLYNWAVSKREQLEIESAISDAKTVIRKMNEVEKMMINRQGEIDEIRDFLDKLRDSKKPSSFKSTELEQKFEKLDEEWRYLEEELRRKESDLNESMSQLLLDEQFEKIQKWIDERSELLETMCSAEKKPSDTENRQKQYEKMAAEISEYLPVCEDFLNNDHVDDEKVHIIRELWSSLIETTTIHQKSLAQEVQKNRLLDLLEDIGLWLVDSEAEVHSAVNFTSLYNTVDAEKASRRLKSLNEQAGEKDDLLRRVRQDDNTKETIEKLRKGISELQLLIKANYEDLDVFKSMQEVIKAIDDEICWYKEISVIVSSTNVGQDKASLDVIRRKHQRLLVEAERRKQKVAKIVDRTTELMSGRRRPSLDSKIDEIDDKLAQLTELLESNSQIAEIRSNRLEKWGEYFNIMEEIREKEHALDQLVTMKKGSPEAVLADVERKCGMLHTIGEQMDNLKNEAEKFSNDEIVRTKAAENAAEKLRVKWLNVTEQMEENHRKLKEATESSKFVWKCDTAIRCIRDQEEKISNLVQQKKPTSNFEVSIYHSTVSFIESYSKETIEKLVLVSRELQDSSDSGKKLSLVYDRLNSLKKQLALLSEKIENDKQRKKRVQSIQDDYSKRACELGNWLEQAEEDVADVVWFQTKESSEDCRHTLLEILELLTNEKVELLGDLELLEVELAELNEDVNTFTWHSYKSLATRMERLDQTISERIRIVDNEIRRHLENEKICEEAARSLKTCQNVILDVRKELDHLHSLKLDDQRDKLSELIEQIKGSGMIRELEQWRSIMGSRYIFTNRFSSATPHGVLVDTCHCLELMSSMLRSVEQSISERNSSGVTEKQIREFELAFQYFDREKKGWLDYEHLELCLKSQGYDFTIETTTSETLMFLDPTNSGRILKADYMRWMVKNETTNILDDHSAIEDALKSLDARKISDSMSRKEAEFFMRKIAKHSETFTEHIHLEYKDFVDSFY